MQAYIEKYEKHRCRPCVCVCVCVWELIRSGNWRLNIKSRRWWNKWREVGIRELEEHISKEGETSGMYSTTAGIHAVPSPCNSMTVRAWKTVRWKYYVFLLVCCQYFDQVNATQRNAPHTTRRHASSAYVAYIYVYTCSGKTTLWICARLFSAVIVLLQNKWLIVGFKCMGVSFYNWTRQNRRPAGQFWALLILLTALWAWN